MLALHSVTKDFGRGPVLRDVTLSIAPSEFLCIVGGGGSGKSTLLSLLMGAETPTTGRVTVDGVDVRDIPAGALQIFRRKLGIVYQDGKLFQTRTVAEHIAFSLEVCDASDAEIRKRTAELLKSLDLESCKNRLPRELSGSERSRTAVGRALAHRPLIILADEPTQNMDMRQAIAVLRTFKNANAAGATVVLATHDAAIVETLKVRVVTLEQGKIVKDTAAVEVAPVKKPVTVMEPREHDFERLERVKTQRKVKITAIRSE